VANHDGRNKSNDGETDGDMTTEMRHKSVTKLRHVPFRDKQKAIDSSSSNYETMVNGQWSTRHATHHDGKVELAE